MPRSSIFSRKIWACFHIVARAQKFASLGEEQLNILLAANGEGKGEDADVGDIGAEGVVAEVVDTEDGTESETAGNLEVSVASSLDIGSFDLTEEFNDGPISASAEDDAELESIFGGAPMAPQMPFAADAMTASIAQLAGVKTASKVGVQSVGSAKLQNSAPAKEGADLDGLWSAPSEFPGGGF